MNVSTALPGWQLGACALGKAYRTGRLTPLQVLDAHLERLELVHPVINAMAWVDTGGARRSAAESTARWHRGQPLSALDGVPVTVKDNIELAGLPCRWGSRLYEGHVSALDESPVARLRAAGAVFLGKTAVPEFTLQGYTDSPVTGVTRNPWDPALTPGGSSGGAVAALAAGVGVLALATDGGGSIRRPAGHTGLYGFKPGWNVVPREQGLPEILPGMEVIGPIARSARDLPLVMAVIGAASAGAWPAANAPPPASASPTGATSPARRWTPRCWPDATPAPRHCASSATRWKTCPRRSRSKPSTARRGQSSVLRGWPTCCATRRMPRATSVRHWLLCCLAARPGAQPNCLRRKPWCGG